MKNVKKYPVNYYSFPCAIISAIYNEEKNPNKEWKLIEINPQPENSRPHNKTFNITYKGDIIFSIDKMHGFGWGSNSSSDNITLDKFGIINGLIPSKVSIDYLRLAIQEGRV